MSRARLALFSARTRKQHVAFVSTMADDVVSRFGLRLKIQFANGDTGHMSASGLIAQTGHLALAFVRPQEVPVDRAAERPGPALRAYFGLVALGGVAVLVASLLGVWTTSAPPVSFVVLLFGAVALGDYLAMPQRRTGNVLTVFSDMLVIASVVEYGPHWSILGVLVVSEVLRYGRILPMAGGPWGAAFNIGQHLLECAAAATLVALLGIESLLLLAACMAVVVFALTCVTMGLVGIVEGQGLRMGRDTLTSEWAYLAANFPFYTLALYTMHMDPHAALLGMLGPTMLAFVSARAQENLVAAERQLGVDGLTGIANRRRLNNELDQAFDRCRRSSLAMAAIMLDIDNFKILNDTHGHLEGDRALVAAASAVARCAGKDRLAARYGGEEFAVLLPGSRPEEALAVAEDIRIACRDALAPWGTTVSVGVAHVPAERLVRYDPEALMAVADGALYESKSNGKNRVTVAAGRHLDVVRERQSAAREDAASRGSDGPSDEPMAGGREVA